MNLFKRIKADRGSSNTVSFMMIMLFVMVMLVSFIDVGIYFNVKNEMRSAAENGARNVALYGGTSSVSGGLRDIRDSTDANAIVESSISSNYASGNIVDVNNIVCGPSGADAAGDRVWCEVEYEYIGIAGRFGLFQLGESTVNVEGVAVSEVGR